MDDQPGGGPIMSEELPRAGHSALIMAVLIVALISAIVFGAWAFSKMRDFRDNVDKKSAQAVAKAEAAQRLQLQAKFDEDSKSPNKIFQGSSTYGSISFNYPKTWSGYVDTISSNEPINGYFYPDVVPGVQSKTPYALRVELVDQDYAQVLQQFNSLIAQGKITARAYVPPKLQGVANVTAGTYMTGQIDTQDQTQTGNMVVIKVRDKTLEISSQSLKFANDFNNIILGSLTFVP
jgi:hypothetical protein